MKKCGEILELNLEAISESRFSACVPQQRELQIMQIMHIQTTFVRKMVGYEPKSNRIREHYLLNAKNHFSLTRFLTEQAGQQQYQSDTWYIAYGVPQ